MATELLSPEFVASKTTALGVSNNARIAVAVSGGADSVALAVLLHENFDVVALTVDHGLRSAAANEAAQVHEKLTALDITHHVLRWHHEGNVPTGNVQARAREARYKLMADWCANAGIAYLLTAHHQNDQAETLLLRLARGSGIYGLAAMEAVRSLTPTVKLLRPLLSVSKEQIIATLEARGISWIDDPSNEQDKFERVKARKLLRDLPLNGLTPERLAATASRLRRTREAIQFYENEWLQKAVTFHDAGYAELQSDHLQSAPVEVILRGLTSLLRFAGGGDYGPRFEKLERLLAALLSDDFKGYTLGGVQFVKSIDGLIFAVREIAAVSAPQLIDHDCFWDNRFDVKHVNPTRKSKLSLYLGVLGQTVQQGYKVELKEALSSQNIYLPVSVVFDALPAFFNAEKLIAVPHLNYNPESFNLPLLTHRWLSLSKFG